MWYSVIGNIFKEGRFFTTKTDAYANMVEGSKYPHSKELLIIPGASHTDLYDGGGKNAIPFDKLEAFFQAHLG